MEAIIERCAGLDVHQATVVACVLIGQAGRKPHKEIRTFSTMTRDLEALRDWLKDHGVTHVGMESTGIYWKPVHTILEGGRPLRADCRQRPSHQDRAGAQDRREGRRVDRRPGAPRGLVKPSFVPPPPIRDLRDLVRLRRSLAEALATEQNRTLKLLESAKIKLASVVSQVFGRAMLKALIENTATPQEMADLARRKLRRKLEPWRWTAG